MDLATAEMELDARLYRWAKTKFTREVAEDFPEIEQCQHNRPVKCFLTWMRALDPTLRLPICFSLARKIYDQILGQGSDPKTEADFEAHRFAYSWYNNKLPGLAGESLRKGLRKSRS
jgi:hypothetical protein